MIMRRTFSGPYARKKSSIDNELERIIVKLKS